MEKDHSRQKLCNMIGAFFLMSSVNLFALEPEVKEEFNHKHLPIIGEVPSWLKGNFIRNSAIPILEDGKPATHVFDGLAMLHGFHMKEGKVTYSSRYLNTKAYNAVKQGSLDVQGFGSGARPRDSARDSQSTENFVNNASVNVFKYGFNYVALTETPLPVCFDLNSLESLGSLNYADDLPKSSIWESAHPHFDATRKEIINFYIEFGRHSYYVIYRIKEHSAKREIIAKIPVKRPSYMHSFAVTQNHIILVEFPFIVNPLDLRTSDKPFIHNFTWEPNLGTRFTVVEKSTGQYFNQHVANGFFSFHHANSFEQENALVIDLVVYNDFATLKEIFPQAIGWPQARSLETSALKSPKSLHRFNIDLTKQAITSENMLDGDFEFPRFKDELDGQHYRYLYMTSHENEVTQGITKFDFNSKTTATWYEENFYAVEPVFVPNPKGLMEDDGVVLTVMHEKESKQSFLVVLDAKHLKELARALMPSYMPSSFHGQFFSDSLFVHSAHAAHE